LDESAERVEQSGVHLDAPPVHSDAMRTTVSIDDEVLRVAKRLAAEESRTLGDLITEALRERLARRPATGSKPYVAVTSGEGGPLPGVDITNNAAVRDVMDAP
jgi:Arc/MetJ family transcription regulator